MTESPRVSKKYHRAYHVEKYRKSALTATEYSRRHNIPQRRFRDWLQKADLLCESDFIEIEFPEGSPTLAPSSEVSFSYHEVELSFSSSVCSSDLLRLLKSVKEVF